MERWYARYLLPDWLARHSLLVRDVASWIARRFAERGTRLDIEAIEAAAALHDVGKTPLLAGDPREHNDLSALVLAAEGLPHLAELARRHIVYAVREPDLAPRTLEEKIVYYADRRAGQELTSLEERVRDLARRFPREAERILSTLEPAKALERELLTTLGVSPEDVCARR